MSKFTDLVGIGGRAWLVVGVAISISSMYGYFENPKRTKIVRSREAEKC